MSTIKPLYGTSNQTITVTLAGLTNTSARSAVVVDNTSNLFLDALVQLKVKTGSGATAGGYVNIYAYGTADGGTSYPDGAGTDTGVTLNASRIKLMGTIPAATASTSYISEPFSIAAAFGGVLPDHWGIIVENQSGGTFDATGGNFSVFYQGIQLQAV